MRRMIPVPSSARNHSTDWLLRSVNLRLWELKMLTGHLGGKKILPHLSEIVQALLKAPEWRCRYSALIAIGSVADAFLDVNKREQ